MTTGALRFLGQRTPSRVRRNDLGARMCASMCAYARQHADFLSPCLQGDGHLRLGAVFVMLELLALLCKVLLRLVHQRVDVLRPCHQRVRPVLQLVRLQHSPSRHCRTCSCPAAAPPPQPLPRRATAHLAGRLRKLLEFEVRSALVLLSLDDDGLVLVRQLSSLLGIRQSLHRSENF